MHKTNTRDEEISNREQVLDEHESESRELGNSVSRPDWWS